MKNNLGTDNLDSPLSFSVFNLNWTASSDVGIITKETSLTTSPDTSDEYNE